MSKRLFRLLFLFCGIHSLAFFLLYPYIPDTIALNYNLEGVADAFGPKSTLIWLQLTPLGATLMLYLLPRIDPRRKNYETHRKGYSFICIVTTAMLIGMNWVMLLPELGFAFPVGSGIQIILGLSLVAMGNYMPQLRSNFFAGIRTPWALSDEVVWRKTHKMGGAVFCIGGILMVIGAFLQGLPVAQLASLFVFLAGVVWTILYSYLVYRKRHKSKEDEHAEN